MAEILKRGKMKRIKNLWEKIVSLDNLFLAAKKAQKGKRFQDNVAGFNMRHESELFQLQKELMNGTYVPGAYKAFRIREPKLRLISAAPYRDRVVHHALCNVIEPIFEKTFIYDSYACRKRKGTHRAIDRFQEFTKKNRYVLKCDIVKYFPSIDHEILFDLIRRKIGCKDTLWLIKLIIDHSNPQDEMNRYFPGDSLFTPFERRRGIPIGNLTSQFFANIYLNGMDHFIKEKLRCRCYVRYVDDFVVLDSGKELLSEIKFAIVYYLEQLRLTLHPNKCRIYPTNEGTLFLGFYIWPQRRRLDAENIKRFKRKIKILQRNYSNGMIAFTEAAISVRAWAAHASYGETWKLRKSLFRDIVFRKGPVE